MHKGSTDRHDTLVRGHCWHVYPDPATAGLFDSDNPFVDGRSHEPGPPPVEPQPVVVDFWPIHEDAPGIYNDHPGHTYLAITAETDPPTVAVGWFVELARIDEAFELDQGGGRWVDVVRIANKIATEQGPLIDCVFQIDRP
jgi:hypothetical protein